MKILDATCDYITAFCSDIPSDIIYRGYGNRSALPKGQRYVVLVLADTARIGTNVSSDVQAADNVYETKSLREYIVDIDFISDNQQQAQENAGTLEILSRSYIATSFFAEYGIGFNYADTLRYLPFVDQTDQYIHRYRITLHLTCWETVSVPQEYAEKIELNRVENIDAHHKF